MLSTAPSVSAVSQPITIEQLADICEAMESAIVDLSVEYDWFADSPMSLEERLQLIADKPMISVSASIPTFKLVCSLSPPASNNPNAPLFGRFVHEDSVIVARDPNTMWDSFHKQSYDGQIAKGLTIGSSRGPTKLGIISKPDHPIELYVTPLEFSVRCLRLRETLGQMPLSAALRFYNSKQLVRLDNTVRKVNDANSISVDFSLESVGTVYMRIYFSVDHGYTPVRYEHLSGPKPERVALTVEVTSLQEVAKGVWFPSSGAMLTPDWSDKEGNYYQATGKILVNQGLTAKDFDIVFPPGTKVHDEIKDVKYIVPGE
jgi:hypothetical protein